MKIIEGNKFVQLYFDLGDNFIEKDSEIKSCEKFENKFNFNLNELPSIKRLRLDPLNDHCIVHLKNINIISDKGELLSFIFEGNFKYKLGSTFFFNTEDPNLLIELPQAEKITQCEIEISYLSIGSEKTNSYKYLFEKITNLNSQNIDITRKNELLESKIFNIDSILKHLSNQFKFPEQNENFENVISNIKEVHQKSDLANQKKLEELETNFISLLKATQEKLLGVEKYIESHDNLQLQNHIIENNLSQEKKLNHLESTFLSLINETQEKIINLEKYIELKSKETSENSQNTTTETEKNLKEFYTENVEYQKNKFSELENTFVSLIKKTQKQLSDVEKYVEQKSKESIEDAQMRASSIEKNIKDLNSENLQNQNNKIEQLLTINQQLVDENKLIKSKLTESNVLQNEIANFYNSKRFKIGNFITKPIRVFNKNYDFLKTVSPIENVKLNEFENFKESVETIAAPTEKEPEIKIEIDKAEIINNKWIVLAGWALTKCGNPKVSLISEKGNILQDCIYGLHRPDVGAIFENEYESAHNSGFSVLYKLLPDDHIPKKIILDLVDSQNKQIQKTTKLTPSSDFSLLDKESQYQMYIEKNRLSPEDINSMNEKIKNFKYKPKISIAVPVYNVEPKWLDLCIESVKKQTYTNWELCIFDDKSTSIDTINCLKKWSKEDPRIKIGFGKKNANISVATNNAIKMATGEFISLLDNDDELTIDALYWVVDSLNKNNKLDLIYSDEDKMEMNGQRSGPYFKSDFNIDLVRTNNYICHFTTIRKSIGDAFGWFEIGLEGSQDHDVILKTIDSTTPDKIKHISKILYHWRKIPGSTAASYSDKSYAFNAGKKALENHLKRNKLKGKVLKTNRGGIYRILYDYDPSKLISIIIPFKDEVEMLKVCIESIFENTTYKNFEIILVSNNSVNEETLKYCKELVAQNKNIQFHEYNIPFNYSKINNWAVEKSKGEYVLFLNNDTKVISKNWLTELARFCQRKNTGAVGARLLYEDMTIQHAGIIVGMTGVAGHCFKNLPKDQIHHFSYGMEKNMSACTAACLLVKKSVFKEIKGFNEKDFKVAFNDIDLCLRIRQKGFLIVYNPYCELIHYESKSRGYENSPEKLKRFKQEIASFKSQWKENANKDEYYNINLSTTTTNYDIKI